MVSQRVLLPLSLTLTCFGFAFALITDTADHLWRAPATEVSPEGLYKKGIPPGRYRLVKAKPQGNISTIRSLASGESRDYYLYGPTNLTHTGSSVLFGVPSSVRRPPPEVEGVLMNRERSDSLNNEVKRYHTGGTSFPVLLFEAPKSRYLLALQVVGAIFLLALAWLGAGRTLRASAQAWLDARGLTRRPIETVENSSEAHESR